MCAVEILSSEMVTIRCSAAYQSAAAEVGSAEDFLCCVQICILIFIGTNGETYFNTAALVACVRNFPRSRGPIVGILKGFAGLSGAIFTVLYTAIYAPDQAAFIYMIAVGPALIAILFSPVIRALSEVPLGQDPQESFNFNFIYGVCLALAAYLLGVMLVQDLFPVEEWASILFSGILVVLLVLPLVTALRSDAVPAPTPGADETVSLLPNPSVGPQAAAEFSELEDEKFGEEAERRRRVERGYNRLLQAISEGAVKVQRKRRSGPRRGEDFTLRQALCKADFWLLFFSLFCGAASGLTAIDNLGQMATSQGYDYAHIFVSMISIFNFLGRIGGGYLSEVLVVSHATPRTVVLVMAQSIMAVGHLLFALAWPGMLYVGCLLVGLGYGAHWSIVPATASELFGLKHFGTLYNFLTVAMPFGTLLWSGVVAGHVYDHNAAKQHGVGLKLEDDALACYGAVCFRLTFLIMTGVCIFSVLLNLILIARTRRVYLAIYGKNQASILK